jgi:hypothetical protein
LTIKFSPNLFNDVSLLLDGSLRVKREDEFKGSGKEKHVVHILVNCSTSKTEEVHEKHQVSGL